MAGSLGLFWHLGRHLEGRDVLQRLLALGGSDAGPRSRAAGRLHRGTAPSLPGPPEPAVRRDRAGEPRHLRAEGDQLPSRAVQGAARRRGRHRRATPNARRRCWPRPRSSSAPTATTGGWASSGSSAWRPRSRPATSTPPSAVGRAAAARFRQLDDYWGLSAILYHLGWGLRQFGRNEEGAHDLEEAIDVAASAGLYNTVQWALADLALVHLNLGRRDVARDLFDRADAASEHVGDGAGTVLAHYGHGLLALQDGDVDEAERRFALARDGFCGAGDAGVGGVGAS